MALPYLSENINNPDGVPCAVLDSARVDFSAAARGRKSAETLVREAKGGESIVTRNTSGEIESTYTAQKGDAIFINLHNPDDVYVPGNADGTRWQFSELGARGYAVVGQEADGGVRVKIAAYSPLLVEAVEKPTCIRDAWGAGQHQFLYPGATLKDGGNGRVTGIDKSAFDATWEVQRKAGPGPA